MSAVKEGTDDAAAPGSRGPCSHAPGGPLTRADPPLPPLLVEAPPLLVLPLALRADRKASAAEATLWPRSPAGQ
jgi:hypothetical protein